MKLLLDTHIWLWTLLEPERLPPELADHLRDAGHELWLSPISVWEAILLAEKGRVVFDLGPVDGRAATCVNSIGRRYIAPERTVVVI